VAKGESQLNWQKIGPRDFTILVVWGRPIESKTTPHLQANVLKQPVLGSFQYSLAGLKIISELEIAGLPPVIDRSQADAVTTRIAEVPPALDGAPEFDDVAYGRDEVLLRVPDVARFLVRGGAEILVDPAPAVEANLLNVFLLGSAFGILCHQRGILPLHSAAIEAGNGVIAFVGDSGAGKSTLAAALLSRGHRVIADDVSFLRGADNDFKLWPGVARIRLSEDAMNQLGIAQSEVERENRGESKFVLRIPFATTEHPRRLLRIYRLCDPQSGQAEGISRLRGLAAIDVILQNVYRLGFAEHMGKLPQIFEICAGIARRIPVFEFVRPVATATVTTNLDLLESHLRES
jgi:hypothetical protein